MVFLRRRLRTARYAGHASLVTPRNRGRCVLMQHLTMRRQDSRLKGSTRLFNVYGVTNSCALGDWVMSVQTVISMFTELS